MLTGQMMELLAIFGHSFSVRKKVNYFYCTLTGDIFKQRMESRMRSKESNIELHPDQQEQAELLKTYLLTVQHFFEDFRVYSGRSMTRVNKAKSNILW